MHNYLVGIYLPLPSLISIASLVGLCVGFCLIERLEECFCQHRMMAAMGMYVVQHVMLDISTSEMIPLYPESTYFGFRVVSWVTGR